MPISKEQMQKLQSKADERLNSLPSDKHDSQFPPIVFLKDGETVLRLYLDSDVDYLARKAFHSYFPAAISGRKKPPIYVPCSEDDQCEICNDLIRHAFIPREKRFSFDKQVRTIFYGCIMSTTMPTDHVVLNTPCMIIAPASVREEIDSFITEMYAENLQSFFDPGEAENCWKIVKEKYTCKTTLSQECATMPPLPSNWAPLKECLYTDGEPPDPRSVNTIRARLQELGRLCHTISDPKPDPSQNLQIVRDSLNRSSDTNPATEPTVPVQSSFKGPAPDKKPDCYGEWVVRHHGIDHHPDCVLCQFEDDCSKLNDQ